MRFSSSLLLLLPALAAADQQSPLGEFGESVQANVQAWFSKLQSFIPSAPSAAPSASAPFEAGAAKVAERKVTPLTLENWRSTLTPSVSATTEGPEEWMVFITGGNKTCYGMCGPVEAAWNESVALLSAAPSPPNLGYLDCDKQPVLCNAWSAGPSSVWYIHLPVPQPDQSKPSTTIHIIQLNRTATAPTEIAKIHTSQTWKETEAYEGVFHPFDGLFANLGLSVPLGYALWAFAAIPSWAFMLGISFLSRTFMGRRGAAPPARPAGGAART